MTEALGFGRMRKLIQVAKRCMMTHQRRKGLGVKTIILSDEDAEQVKAILLTHSEMTDNHAMPSLELIGSMRAEYAREPDDEVKSMIAQLTEQVTDFEVDSENLKRLASLFGDVS